MPKLLDIIYEDDDVLVVNKPPGLLTATVASERRATLWAMVRQHVEPAAGKSRGRMRPRAGLIHRLDRDASGLLVFSKNDRTYRSLKTQFFHHSVERIYMAVVHGAPEPPAGTIQSRLVERTDGSVHSTRQRGKGQLAVTQYTVLRSAGRKSLLRIKLHTGRKHQIRAHLSEKGCPIVGDRMYGPQPSPANVSRLMLVATELSFDHPRHGKRPSFELRLPDEMTRLLQSTVTRASVT